MRRVATGDAEAFAQLFRRCQGQVYRFALHMTASPSVAEDVTQDVFLAVMSDAGRYDAARASVASWLCGIARNHVRRRAERDRLLQPLGDGDAGEHDDRLDELMMVDVDTLGDLTRAESIDALREAVLTLPVQLSRGGRALRSAGDDLRSRPRGRLGVRWEPCARGCIAAVPSWR